MSREVMQQALDALEVQREAYDGPVPLIDDALDALREELAKPEPAQPARSYTAADVLEAHTKGYELGMKQESTAHLPAQPATEITDLADLIAGVRMVSRATAYDMMREALVGAQPAERKAGCTLCGHCAATGERITAQRKPLTDDEFVAAVRAVLAAHGIKEKT